MTPNPMAMIEARTHKTFIYALTTFAQGNLRPAPTGHTTVTPIEADQVNQRLRDSSQRREGKLLIYCLLVFCTTATLNVSKSICADIRAGTLAIFAQSRGGALRLANGRFLSSSTFSLLTVSIFAATLISLGERFPRIDLRDSLVLLAVLLQAFIM